MSGFLRLSKKLSAVAFAAVLVASAPSFAQTVQSSAGPSPSAGSSPPPNINTPVDVRYTFTLDATKTSGAGSFVDIPLNGQGIVALGFTGLAASGATITYASSNASSVTPASPISAYNAALSVTAGTRTTDGETRIPVAGRTTLRLQITSPGTGTISGYANATGISVSGIVDIGSPVALSSTAGAGGVSNSFLLPSSANNTNLTNVAAGARRLYKIVGYNTLASSIRLRLYDAATVGAVTVGTTPIKYSRILPPGPFTLEMADIGWGFANGITFALVVNAAPSDATAPAAGAVTDLELDYQ